MRKSTIITFLLLVLIALFVFKVIPLPPFIPVWIAWVTLVILAIVVLNDLAGNPIPFFRWSFLRMLFGMKTLLTKWQVGDGREAKVEAVVLKKAVKGDPASVIRVIDNFAHHDAMLINVGDEKGPILDAALERTQPKKVLELGTYVGYSATRIAQKLRPGAHLYSVEFSEANAAIARKIIEHGGLSDMVTIVNGTISDGGKTIDVLENEYGFTEGSLDFVFIDHDKVFYLPDLKLIMKRGWLHSGSVVVADNIKFPGAPDYLAYMEEQENKLWKSRSHKAHVEYQSVIPDIVLESEYIG